jgi:hypothetical protein
LEILLLLLLHLQWLLVPNTKVSFILFSCDIINFNIISQLHLLCSLLIKYINCSAFSLKTMSATRLYTNVDIPEAKRLIEMHSGDVSIPKIMDVFRNMQGTVEEQIFHYRCTLLDITQMRQGNICNEVTYLLFFPSIRVPHF